MLDLKFIRDNVDAVKANIITRGVRNADADAVVALYEQRNSTIQEMERLRKERNDASHKMKAKLEPDDRARLIDHGRVLKDQIATLEAQLNTVTAMLESAARNIPNMTHPDSPVGGEDEGRVIATIGQPPAFDFEPKDHVTLGQELDILDFDSASAVTGQKFYYLKNDGALLELALVNYAMNKLVSRGYTPYITPDLARVSVLEAIGFNPRGEETQVYSIADTDLCLIGTAEITLGGYLQDRILRKEDLPVRMVGFSHCFRTEAGAYGKESRGLYRVHQFSKVEMFAFTSPETSAAMHQEMCDIETEIFSELGLCFRVVDIASGDLGGPAYRKFDLEAWMPGRGGFGEVTSTSNCTDYQARRLNIRYRDEANQTRHVHTLNGTAVACSRAIVSVLENFQQADGSVIIPEVLRPYMGGRERITKK